MHKTKEAYYLGKRCYLSSVNRIQHVKKAWGFYNRATVSFLDDKGKTIKTESMGLGKFNSKAKWTGKILFRNGQLMEISN